MRILIFFVLVSFFIFSLGVVSGPNRQMAQAAGDAKFASGLVAVSKAVARVKGGRGIAKAIESFMKVKKIAKNASKVNSSCSSARGFIHDMIIFVKDQDAAGFLKKVEKRFGVEFGISSSVIWKKFDSLAKKLSKDRGSSIGYLKKVRQIIGKMCLDATPVVEDGGADDMQGD